MSIAAASTICPRSFHLTSFNASADRIEFPPVDLIANIMRIHYSRKKVREEGVFVHSVNPRMHLISFRFICSSPSSAGRLEGCSAAVSKIACFASWMSHTMLSATPDQCKRHYGDRSEMQGVDANASYECLHF